MSFLSKARLKASVIVLATFVAALVLGFAIKAKAGDSLVYDNQLENYKVTLFDTPCAHKNVAPSIKPEFIKKFQAGTLLWEGQTLQLCWAFLKALNPEAVTQEPVIFLIDETGDQGFMSYLQFNPVKDWL